MRSHFWGAGMGLTYPLSFSCCWGGGGVRVRFMRFFLWFRTQILYCFILIHVYDTLMQKQAHFRSFKMMPRPPQYPENWRFVGSPKNLYEVHFLHVCRLPVFVNFHQVLVLFCFLTLHFCCFLWRGGRSRHQCENNITMYWLVHVHQVLGHIQVQEFSSPGVINSSMFCPNVSHTGGSTFDIWWHPSGENPRILLMVLKLFQKL
jgi:hypothetical protein